MLNGDGGPAFPCRAWGVVSLVGELPSQYGEVDYSGLSIRDYFAAKALACMNNGLIRILDANLFDGHVDKNEDRQWAFKVMNDAAATAYGIADAMLKTRSACEPVNLVRKLICLPGFKVEVDCEPGAIFKIHSIECV